jgi:photosystem II PsbU protein
MAGRIDVQPVTLLAVTTQLPKPSDAASCIKLGQKIDLNNANIIAFKDCKGFYPTLASSIIKNSPYQAVEDVLKISELSDRQKELLKSHLDLFTVTDPVVSLEMRMPPRPMMR